MPALTEMRLRTRVHPDTVAAQIGKLVDDGDYSILLTGPSKVSKPDGRPLAIYLPGVLCDVLMQNPDIAETLYSIKNISKNRGLAGGTQRIQSRGSRSYARDLPSSIVGAIDPVGQTRWCRLTAWTGTHVPEYHRLQVLLAEMAGYFARLVPDRYDRQMTYVQNTQRDWIIPNTPFSTLTVNNTYATGVHQDKGDLASGFSCLAVLRRGTYSGGRLVFPEYRVAVDMQHGDLLLMDAHEWHGNTKIHCPHGFTERKVNACTECHGERVSVVAYYREKIIACGTAEEEYARAQVVADRRTSINAGKGGSHGDAA